MVSVGKTMHTRKKKAKSCSVFFPQKQYFISLTTQASNKQNGRVKTCLVKINKNTLDLPTPLIIASVVIACAFMSIHAAVLLSLKR